MTHDSHGERYGSSACPPAGNDHAAQREALCDAVGGLWCVLNCHSSFSARDSVVINKCAVAAIANGAVKVETVKTPSPAIPSNKSCVTNYIVHVFFTLTQRTYSQLNSSGGDTKPPMSANSDKHTKTSNVTPKISTSTKATLESDDDDVPLAKRYATFVIYIRILTYANIYAVFKTVTSSLVKQSRRSALTQQAAMTTTCRYCNGEHQQIVAILMKRASLLCTASLHLHLT